MADNKKRDAILDEDTEAQQVENARPVDTVHRVTLTEEDVSVQNRGRVVSLTHDF
jgi:hypothetical protein